MHRPPPSARRKNSFFQHQTYGLDVTGLIPKQYHKALTQQIEAWDRRRVELLNQELFGV